LRFWLDFQTNPEEWAQNEVASNPDRQNTSRDEIEARLGTKERKAWRPASVVLKSGMKKQVPMQRMMKSKG